jgi:carboxyl-terminal processing protease
MIAGFEKAPAGRRPESKRNLSTMNPATRFASLAALSAALLAAQAPQVASFDRAWTLVKEKHWDPALNGVDWDAVRAELRPAAEKATTAEETRKVIQQMVARLGQSHFAIIPKDAYEPMETGSSSDGDTGLEIRVVDGLALITGVAPDSPAAKAGIWPGWILTAVDGKKTAELIARAAKASTDPRKQALAQYAAVYRQLLGKKGETLMLELRGPKDVIVNKGVTLDAPRGQLAQLGNFPPLPVWYESRRLPEEIGYFRLSAFFDPPRVLGAFGDAVQSCKDCRGFIIDLRGNPGGIGAMAMGMAGWFLREEVPLGRMNTRTAELKFTVNPRLAAFPGPVAILVDSLSMSTSEIFAGGMQDLKRARIFGEPTPGAALPSLVEVLPNGDGFQYAMANYVSASGKVLEGNGVLPDVEVRPARAALLAGRDPVIDAASKWILEDKRHAIQ